MNPLTKTSCKFCDYSSPSGASMAVHVRTEHKNNKVTELNGAVVVNDEVVDDIKTDAVASGDKNKDVKKNKKVTKPVKKVKCDQCDFSTKRSAYLPKHKENVHQKKKENRKRPKPDETASATSSPTPKVNKVDKNDEDLNKTMKQNDDDNDEVLKKQLENLKDPDNTNYKQETDKVVKIKRRK